MHRLRASILATGLMLTAPMFAQTLAPERVLNDVNVLADSCTQASDSRQALDSAALTRALSSLERDVTDFLRDKTRKPVQTLEFLALERGMRVLDLYAAGGYYTVVLSQAVGESGCVFAQNTQRGRAFIEDRQAITQGEALDTKIRTANLNNVTHCSNQNRSQRCRNDNHALHRMPEQQAIALGLEAGFEVTSSDLLRVHSDDHSRSVFDPRLARITDRFLLRLLKPAR